MTVVPAFQECPKCGGKGWYIHQPLNFDPAEQTMCERCDSTGYIDPLDKPDNSEPMGKETDHAE